MADFSENQRPVVTSSPTSMVPELASQLIDLLFGQSESGTTPSAPASANSILANQLQALAQGLQALASWRPTNSGASEAASKIHVSHPVLSSEKESPAVAGCGCVCVCTSETSEQM